MINTLTLDSPAQLVIADLRRAVTLNFVKPMPVIKGIRPSELRLKEPLARAHVFDFGVLLNPVHRDSLSAKAQVAVNEASRDRGIAGLLLPFPQTVFLVRNLPHKGYFPGVTGFIQVLVLLEHVHGLAAHHFYRAFGGVCNDWGWAGSAIAKSTNFMLRPSTLQQSNEVPESQREFKLQHKSFHALQILSLKADLRTTILAR